VNPELQRNLWLEVTLHRLVLVPVIIIAGAMLLHTLDSDRQALGNAAMVGFLISTVGWGARQAAASVLEEARSHTWDIQRMCALSSWRMTWGKLLGATVIPWYAGLCCLLPFVFSQGAINYHDGLVVLLGLAVAVLAQATAMIYALLTLHRGGGQQSRTNSVFVVLLLLVVLSNAADLIDAQATLSWYAFDLPRLPFVTVATISFAAWAVLGATRAMSLELKIGTWPGPWLGFTGFVAVFAAGFIGIPPMPSLGLISGLFGALTLTAIVQSYVAAFAYPSDAIQFRRTESALRAQRWARVLEELPLWSISAALALAAAMVVTVLGSAPQFTNQRLDNLGPVSLAVALMMLRDIALLTYFGMISRKGRAEATALVYIGILDGLLPALLDGVGLASLTPLFWPPFFTEPLTAIGIMSVHAAIALGLAVYAYRHMQARLNGTTGE
jgi:hypothetical protein